MALEDYQELVDAKLRDTGNKISVPQRDLAITEAVNRYSRSRPRTKILTLTGNGVLVTHPLPADFEEGVSSLQSIEYPIGRQDPEFLDEADYRLYRDPVTSVLGLRLLTLVLPNTVQAYVSYTGRHQVTEGPAVDTVPRIDREAVANLATAICLEELAAYYLGTGEPNYQMAVVAYQSKSAECLAAARVYKASYREHVGVSDGVVAASVSTDLDTEFSEGGSWFYHGGKNR